MTSLDILNDDALSQVLSHLTLSGRLPLEIVSKRWRRLLLASYSKIRTLNISDHLSAELYKTIPKKNELLDAIFKRCGEHLESLKLANVKNYRTVQSFTAKFEITNRTIRAIADHCQNLQRLDLSHHYFPSERTLELLSILSPNLKELRLENCRLDVISYVDATGSLAMKIVEAVFRTIFGAFPSLEIFSLRYSCFGYLIITDEMLIHLPATLRVLDLSGGYSLKIANLAFAQRLNQLCELHIERTAVTDSDLASLCDSKSGQLTGLTLSYSKRITDFSPIAKLSKIEYLHLDGNRENLQDNALAAICQQCRHLRHLSLESCSRLTVTGLKFISSLTSLQYLSVNNVQDICDEILHPVCCLCLRISNLQIKFCRRVTANGLKCLSQLSELETLGVSGLADFDQSIIDELLLKTKLSSLDAYDCAKGLNAKLPSS